MQTLREPLITAAKALEGAAGLCFVDCRFRLDDPAAGRRAYADHRLPGAHFLDLEADLSGPIDLTRTGRHPFPSLLVAICDWSPPLNRPCSAFLVRFLNNLMPPLLSSN